MTTHTSIKTGTSQCERILEILSTIPGEWVAMPILALKSGSYNVHSRISDLRKKGHVIEQKSAHGKPEKSFYRLVELAPSHIPLDLKPAKDG